MTLIELLQRDQEQIIRDAVATLQRRAAQSPYHSSSTFKNQERLRHLYLIMMECLMERQVVTITEYARQLARERFSQGFDLPQVQLAFNALEETIWQHITANLAPSDYPEAFGIISTALGAGKDALASEYVSLATQEHSPTLNLDRLS